jgi:Mrp family chromosome partitioning ATPase
MSDDAFFRLGLRVLSKLPAGEAGRVVVVTSARDGEGKTFVARALAQAMAEQCSGPVAVLSCTPDARQANGTGWSELVNTGAWQEGMARRHDTQGSPSNLSEISAGSQSRVETLFKPDAVQAALQALRQRFSLVIVDAPSLPQCGALPRHADGAVLVVNAKSTRREVVQGALAANPIPVDRLLGTVLNQRPDYVPGWLYRWVL